MSWLPDYKPASTMVCFAFTSFLLEYPSYTAWKHCTEECIVGCRKYHTKCVLQQSLGAEMLHEHHQRLVLQKEYILSYVQIGVL